MVSVECFVGVSVMIIIIIMYSFNSFMRCFSKLDYIAHYKVKNQNTVKKKLTHAHIQSTGQLENARFER